MKRFALGLEKIFCVIFAFFVIGMAISAFHGVKDYEINLLWKIGSVIVILFFVYITCCSANLPKNKTHKNVVSIFALSLCVHLFITWSVEQYTEQISDFAMALDLSKKSFPLTEAPDHYRIFSNWAIYPLHLKLIQELFGYGAFTGIIFNAILCAFSSTFIYLLFHIEGGVESDRVGYLAALIYTFWPSHLLYLVILTPEFLNIFLTLLFGCCIQVATIYYNQKFIYCLTGLAAVILALSGFFKSIDKIILVALVIMLTLSILKGEYIKFIGCEHRNALYKQFLIIVIFIGSYMISNKLIFAGLDYAYGDAVNRNPTAHFVYIGLNSETYGTWNENVFGVYKQNVIECNYDYKMASDLTYQQLKEEISGKRYLTATYFKNKFTAVWENNAETYWVNETIKDNSPFLKKPEWFFSVGALTQNYWLVICLFVCIEAFFLLFSSDRIHMFICLILFGFACLMLLVEVQSRYKCVMYPILSILSADGIIRLDNALKSINCNKKE